MLVVVFVMASASFEVRGKDIAAIVDFEYGCQGRHFPQASGIMVRDD